MVFALLPTGALAKWILLTAFFSTTSTLQSLHFSAGVNLIRKIYTAAPAPETSGLAARLFGTWNALSTVVRVYAAYDMDNRTLYDLCLWTYVIALLHFAQETGFWGTTEFRKMLALEITPVITIVWMVMARAK
ncbi:Erg28-like protein [Exidia glandulosa HHB12029]|uniref:Erg28-like protein n=1 Tax=Exidia glandulosa HHB12029 TaxID=1314781 RepID=A0A165K9C9_EXIGL|nr:Erg28-like protein [Exidia glandulosa HHB12029]